MLRRSSRFPERAFAFACAFAASSAAAKDASAQACCAGASALSPGRLALHEDALAGVQVRAADIYGSFDPHRAFVASPSGAAEVDFEEDAIATVRVAKHGQLSALMPIDETWRKASGISEAGGGLGDVQAALRWDFVDPGASLTIPGIAVSFGLTLPTGRAPEDATNTLATDATGTGVFQGAAAIAIEQVYGRFLFNVTGSGALRATHTVGGVSDQQGPLFTIFGAAGAAFSNGAAIAFTATYSADFAERIGGVTQPDSTRAFTRLAIAGGGNIFDTLRAQGSVFSDLPIHGLGQNEALGFGATFMLLRTWI